MLCQMVQEFMDKRACFEEGGVSYSYLEGLLLPGCTIPMLASASSGGGPSRPYAEAPEEGPRREPRDHKQLLHVMEIYGCVPMLGGGFAHFLPVSRGRCNSFP